jgi:hypothetical protein
MGLMGKGAGWLCAVAIAKHPRHAAIILMSFMANCLLLNFYRISTGYGCF